ncbi:MAG: alkaline phosphatase [Nocardioides sp.]
MSVTLLASSLTSTVGTPSLGTADPVSAPPRRDAMTTSVLAISVDALNPSAIRKLGRAGVPNLFRLIDEGASTLDARTARELTLTLPNHTSMVTGRRVEKAQGGHGVTWNTDRPGTTVQGAAGHGVASIFTVVHAGGDSSAVFSTKEKFSLFKRSWGEGIDRFLVAEEDDLALMKAARADLVQNGRALTFVHFGGADKAGHDTTFLGPRYLDAVRLIDRLVGNLLRAIDRHDSLADTVVVLTADHGGSGEGHSDATKRFNYTVPFVVAGPGVSHGDLYELNPAYADPGRARTDYAGRQPIRNADLANLVADLLGLAPVPGSEFGTAVDWQF